MEKKNKGKIVFITRNHPSDFGGGNNATRAYLEALVKLYPNRVTLFVTDNFNPNVLNYVPNEIIKVKPRFKLVAIFGVFFGKLTRFEKSVSNWLSKNKNNIDFVVFDGGIIGGTYCDIFQKNNCKCITIHHNYEVDYHKENKSIESLKGYFLFWIKFLEKKAYLNSALNLFLTQHDLIKFEFKYNSKRNSQVIGCFEFSKKTNYYDNKYNFIDNNELSIVISGSLNFHQSLDGVIWFIDKIYDRLKFEHPSIQVTITGKDPNKFLIDLCMKKGIKIIASPANIRAVIAQHKIYICPTKLGSGLKLRIMDALALGLPSVIHEKSYRGYEKIGKSEFVSMYNDESDFFSVFNNILKQIRKHKNYKEILVRNYQKEFSFNAGVKRLEFYINQLK